MSESSSKHRMTQSDPPPKPWRRAVNWSLLSLVAVAAALTVFLFTADLGVLKPQLERWVSEKTGRELHIDGPLLVQLGGTSIVRAERVRLENAQWAGEAAMFEVGVLNLRFDLWSIFAGQLVVELVEIDDARIRLATHAENGSNLVFGVTETPDDDAEQSDFRVLLEHLAVDNVELSYESPGRIQPLVIHIDSLRQRRERDDFLALSLNGDVGGRKLELRGRVGTWQALLERKNVQYDLEAQLDTTAFSSKGSIDNLAKPSRPQLEFSAVGPSIDDLSRMFGFRRDAAGDIEVRASLTPTPDGLLTLRVVGNVGEAQIEADGSVSDLQNLRQMRVDMLASGPNLGELFFFSGVDQVREAPFMIDINATRDGSVMTVDQANMVFGESRFDLTAKLPHFPSLDDGVVELDVNGPDIARLRYLLRLPGTATGAFSLRFGLLVSPLGEESITLQGRSNLGTVEASGSLGPAPNHFGSRLEFRIASDDLSQLGSAWGIDDLPDRPLELAGGLEYNERGLQTVNPLVATVSDVIARVEGLIVPRRGLFGTDVTFDLTGPDLSALAAAFAVSAGVPDQAYVFDGRLQIVADGYRFRSVKGKVGRSLVDVDGLVSTRQAAVGTYMDFSASGPAFEELVGEIGGGKSGLEVIPGDYELSGRVELQPGRLRLSEIELDRELAKLELDLSLGLPLSERWADFELRGTGSDVRTMLRRIGGFEADEVPFRIAAKGQRRGTDWSIDRFDIDVADASATARGTLELDDDAASTRFLFSGNIPSLANFGMLNGYRMRNQKVSWDVRVTGDNGQLRFENLVASLGGSDINGSVIYRVGDVPELTVDIRSDAIIFPPLSAVREREYDPQPALEDGRLIPDLPISLPALRSINASLRLDVGEFARDALHIRDIELEATLRDGDFRLPTFGFRGRAGRFDARASFEAAEDLGKASVEIVARDFAFGMSEFNQDLAMTGDIDVKLEATGRDLRALLGSASGAVLLNVRGGRVSNNRFMQTLYGNLFDEIVATVNPFFSADTHTNLECVVIPYTIDDGQMQSVPNSFVGTGKIRIASKGAIDLKTENIDVNVRTTPKRSLGISAGEIVNPYVKIVGTLGSPRLAVDEKGVLLSGGAAVATGGLSILAKAAWDRLSRAQDPCADTAAQAIEALAERLPVWGVPEAVELER